MRHSRLLAAALLAVAAAAAPAHAHSAGTPQTGGRLVLAEHFDSLRVGPGQTWGWQSAAYSNCTVNTDSWKLDRLTQGALSTGPGYLTITATPRPDGRWDTGLLTTGDSCDSGGSGAEIRTGDLVLVHVRLPGADIGAWPGLWTWRDGKNEMDVFEWHSDAPNTLEFVNHVKSADAVSYVTDPDLISPGRWLYVATRFGAENTTWYLGTSLDQLHPAASDQLGVGPDFAAYPILNLSVSEGHFHRAPTGTRPLTMAVDLLLIERPEGVNAAPAGASGPRPSHRPVPGCPTPPADSARCTPGYRWSG